MTHTDAAGRQWFCGKMSVTRTGRAQDEWNVLRAPLKTRHFGEGKEAARGKPECMGEYMRM